MAPRLTALAAALAVLAAVLAGCGTSEYTYVKNSAAKTYFKVPAEWKKIDQKTLDEALNAEDPASATARLRRKLTWSVAYDADASPDPTHLYGLGSDGPFVYAVIRKLTPDQDGMISLNVMRDVFLPVTDEGRAAAAERGARLSGFELLRNEVLRPGGGLRGVRTIYNYEVPPMPLLQTFDVTSYSSDDGRLYTLILRCSARCYRDRKGEFEDIAQSFTVRRRS